MTEPKENRITFKAQDGWELVADLYRGDAPKLAVLVSSGTGFPRRFYRHMATYLAARGCIVLTYDYRGIGESGSDDLANSGIRYTDWGRYDLPAAIRALQDAAPGLPITHIAHSVGGHFLGLAPNHDAIARHAFVSVGSGYIGHHHWRSIPLEAFFWLGIGPYSLARWGYVRPVGGWKGEALPPDVFRTWRKWCFQPRYFAQSVQRDLAPEHYAAVTSPIRSWIFSDDPIATERTSQTILQMYPNAPKEMNVTKPSNYGLKRIGHEGAFLKGRDRIWDQILDWASGTVPCTQTTKTKEKPTQTNQSVA